MSKLMPPIVASRRYPIIYAPMPKAACTTIQHFLYKIDTGNDYKGRIHNDEQALPRVTTPRLGNDHVRFTIVRSPAPRVYSAFNQKIFANPREKFTKYRNFLEKNFGANFSSSTAEQHIANFGAFLMFVRDNIAGRTNIRMNRHWLPQAMILDHHKAHSIDIIGKVKTLSDDLEKILRSAGYHGQMELKHANVSKRLPCTLEEALTDKNKKLVEEIYEEDYRRFGYR